MIDYLTLLLTNMAAGLVLLAAYVFAGLDGPDQKKWAPGLALAGAIALGFGAHMTMTWPLPGPYSSAFGEMSVLFGAIFAAAALAIALEVSLMTIAAYALFAGLGAIVLGIRIIDLGLTRAPVISGVGFILSGLGGVLAAPTLAWFRSNRALRAAAAAVLVIAALLWAATGYRSYWSHMESFRTWVPPAMRTPADGR